MSSRIRENPRFLREQIVTYLGNKRSLLGLIGRGVQRVRRRLGGRPLRCFDAFAGSGIVSRYLKHFSSCLYSNDIEPYSEVLGRCYLENREAARELELPGWLRQLRRKIRATASPGFLTELYAPADDDQIRPGERVFYTRRNAMYLDTARRLIGELPAEVRPFFLAPLLYEASVHANTSGVFKGFYKNRRGVGQFGGEGRNALSRILGEIRLRLPVLSRFSVECHVMRMDAAAAAQSLPEVDLAYLDPPYNQHPYGSNYFMLNLLAEYRRPEHLSAVSGIPAGWNRSAYNVRSQVRPALEGLLAALPARFVLLSYNSEGFLSAQDMEALLRRYGRVETMQQEYATFRGCRNLQSRAPKVVEYLFLLERQS